MTITKIVGQQPLPMDAPNQNIQHQADGHQPGKAEGLELFARAKLQLWKKPPMLHPGLGQATTSFYDESSRLAMKDPTASSCVQNTKRWGPALTRAKQSILTSPSISSMLV